MNKVLILLSLSLSWGCTFVCSKKRYFTCYVEQFIYSPKAKVYSKAKRIIGITRQTTKIGMDSHSN